jgi:hypothetical protein
VHVNEAVLQDPFLKHNSTSQLALLSDESYQAGMEKIKAALAKAANERIIFRSDIHIKAYVGDKPVESNVEEE